MSSKSGKKSGQSLIEILVAIGVGTIMLLGAIAALAPAIKSQTDVNRSQVGAALGAELMDNVRVAAEANWHNIDTLTTASTTKYFLNTGTSTFLIATGTESVSGDMNSSGLAGYWKFDENSGTIANDSSGSRNNGSWPGALGSQCPTGRAGKCLNLTAGSQQITVNTASSLNIPNAITISFWFYPITIAATSTYATHPITKWTGTTDANYVIYWFAANGSLVLYANAGGVWTGVSGVGIIPSLNTWHHIVFTYTSGAGKGYIDNSLVATSNTTGNLATSTANLLIGKDVSDGSFYLDDVRIYNRVLSASEIYNIYNANIFYRDFYLTPVNRDSGGSGYIVGSGGANDPSTRLLTVEYWWGNVLPKTIKTYLTRHTDNAFWQTDWSGGANVGGPASTTLGNKFATSSNIDYSTSTGALRIFGL